MYFFIFLFQSILSFDRTRSLTGQMAKPEDSGLYTGSLLTLNASSSDEYVKGIYDEWAEKYDKVLPLSVIFHISETIRAMGKIDCKTVRIFAYSSTREQSNKRSATRLKTESETGERRYFFSRLTRPTRALPARKTLTPRFTDFFTGFEKKTDCFVVYGYKLLA